jgi:riboflavin kinase/FMN adenylyltransferase
VAGTYQIQVRVWKERDPAARWSGLMNVGYRPTFGRGPLTCEVHLLACRQRWHGRRVRIELFRRLRDERRFASPEALVRQIHRDLASLRVPSVNSSLAA